jgi:hypothetical protein
MINIRKVITDRFLSEGEISMIKVLRTMLNLEDDYEN